MNENLDMLENNAFFFIALEYISCENIDKQSIHRLLFHNYLALATAVARAHHRLDIFVQDAVLWVPVHIGIILSKYYSTNIP